MLVAKRLKKPNPEPDDEPTSIEIIMRAFVMHGEIPDLPDDITTLDSDELMRHMSEAVEWRNYVDTQVAMHQAEMRSLEMEIKRRRAELGLIVDGANDRERRAAIERDPKLMGLEDEHTKLRATTEMMEVLDGNLGRRIDKLYSREITRRTELDTGRNRRDRHGGG